MTTERPLEITEAYVKGLADPLIRHMGEPPHDALTVLALAVQAALYEAWEQIEHGETHLRMFPNGVGVDVSHGEIMAGKRVIRRVAEALRLFHPGERFTPGERVLATRSLRGLAQPDVADAADIHRSHLSRIERGQRVLTPLLAGRLAAVLDVTPEYLLTGKDPDGQAHSEA